MSGYSGALPHIVLSRTLWLLLVPPWLGFVWHASAPYRRPQRAAGRLSARLLVSVHGVGIAAVGLPAIATLAEVIALRRASASGAVLFDPLARGVRVGRLDAPIALSFDGLSAVACVLACLAALAAAAWVAFRPPPDPPWQVWGWIELSLAGALLSFLADGLFTLSLGWALAAGAGAWLSGWGDAKAAVHAATRSAVALAALVLGASLLFWGLGGTWRGDDYGGDAPSGFVAVRVSDGDETARADGPDTAGGALTMAARPGTALVVDDARVAIATSPFVAVPLAPGLHTLHLLSAPLSNDALVASESLGDGSWDLVFFGPTLSFHEMAALGLVRDDAGAGVLARSLALRLAPGGRNLVSCALALWILAAWAMSGPSLQSRAPGAISAMAYGVTTALLGPCLLARASFLLDTAPRVRVLVASVGAATLVTAFRRGLGGAGPLAPFRWSPFLARVPVGVAWIALGVTGRTESTMVSSVLIAAGLVAGALLLLRSRRTASDGASTESDAASAAMIAAILLEQLPARVGMLLVSYELWVIDATGRALVALIRVAAWGSMLTDRHVFGAPADAAAARLVRLGRRLAPAVGGSLAAVAWAVLGFFASAGLVFTMWFRR